MLIHQLREELNENDLSIMVQQLQKDNKELKQDNKELQQDNKELQQLVDKYKELEHVETTLTGTQTDEIHVEKTTAVTQTDEVQLYSYRLYV